ncbi:complement C1q-like protein 2 [Pagrus major]|uniref:complement C1q-like protein 2 n=1 Tax=Pagrus major TaxID=143350 RepID=UPI003CC8A587
MENISVLMVVCLLAGLSECLAGEKGTQTQVTELTNEDVADTSVENDAIHNLNQGLETPAVLTTNSTGTQPRCEPPIYTVLKQLGALEERLAATVRALEETNKKLEASEKKLSALNSTVTELSAEDKGRPRVAFSAALPVDGTIGPADVLYSLVYRHVLSNIGGHYNTHTGYFTAPVQGVYYFTFTSFCWALNPGSCGGSLYKNGDRVVSWYDLNNNHPSSGSNSAVLQLQVGDKVNVRLWNNMRISDNGNKYSSFSGFLLFPV